MLMSTRAALMGFKFVWKCEISRHLQSYPLSCFRAASYNSMQDLPRWMEFLTFS